MTSEFSPFSAERDAELGHALREALEPPFHQAFVGRVMARLGQRQAASVDDILARWFWQGLAAASMALVAAGWGITRSSAVDVATSENSASPTVAEQLLDGSTPAAQILMASVAQDISQ